METSYSGRRQSSGCLRKNGGGGEAMTAGRGWEMGGFIVYIVLVVGYLEPSNPGRVAYIYKYSGG